VSVHWAASNPVYEAYVSITQVSVIVHAGIIIIIIGIIVLSFLCRTCYLPAD